MATMMALQVHHSFIILASKALITGGATQKCLTDICGTNAALVADTRHSIAIVLAIELLHSCGTGPTRVAIVQNSMTCRHTSHAA